MATPGFPTREFPLIDSGKVQKGLKGFDASNSVLFGTLVGMFETSD